MKSSETAHNVGDVIAYPPSYDSAALTPRPTDLQSLFLGCRLINPKIETPLDFGRWTFRLWAFQDCCPFSPLFVATRISNFSGSISSGLTTMASFTADPAAEVKATGRNVPQPLDCHGRSSPSYRSAAWVSAVAAANVIASITLRPACSNEPFRLADNNSTPP